jgi:1-acyl-sn-glycerol-3-phosphate acyltransferase
MHEVKPYRVPFKTRVNRLLMKPTFRFLFHILGGVKISGKENIPYEQPYIAAMNHVSIFDPPFVLSFWPEMMEAIGAVDVWGRKGQGTIVEMYGTIPVHRGEYDRRLLETIHGILASGRPLLIAPEGGRSHMPGMRRAMPGIGYILDAAQVPVVPVGLVGTTDDYWQRARRGERPMLEMRIGKPFRVPRIEAKGEARRAARQQNADLVMAHIADLLPQNYRGYYANQVIVPASA